MQPDQSRSNSNDIIMDQIDKPENIIVEQSEENQNFLRQSQEIILQQNGTEQVVFQRQDTKSKELFKQTYSLTCLLLYRILMLQLQFIIAFVIIILIYKNVIQYFSWIFFVRAILFFSFIILDVIYYFKFRRGNFDYHNTFIYLGILDFIDFIIYFFIFLYLQTSQLQTTILVLVFIHLLMNFILYCNSYNSYISVFRSQTISIIESLILIFFVYKVARNTDSYSWNKSFIFFGIIAYAVLVICSLFIIGSIIFFLCLLCTPEGRLVLIHQIKVSILVLFFLLFAAQGIIFFCFYYGFRKVCQEGWVQAEKVVGDIHSQFLYKTSIAGIVIYSIFIIMLWILGRKFAKALQQIIFKQDADKVQKVSLVSLKKTMTLNAEKVSDQYFKKSKEEKKTDQKTKKIKKLSQCVICFDHKANCLQEPCGHIVACQECQIEVFKKNNRKCINCRQPIEKIYIVKKDEEDEKFKIIGMLKIIQLYKFQLFFNLIIIMQVQTTIKEETSMPKKHTTEIDVYALPIIALKCKEGILIATNPIGRRGNNLRYKNLKRYSHITSNLTFTSSGDYSDFQKVTEILDNQWHKLSVYADQKTADPKAFGQYLANVLYKQRSKIDPYYIEGILAGVKDGQNYLAITDLYGNYFENNYIATGFARYLCPVLLDKYYKENMTFEEGKKLLMTCFKVIYSKFKLSNDEVLFCYQTETEQRQEKVQVEVNFSFKGFLEKEDVF